MTLSNWTVSFKQGMRPQRRLSQPVCVPPSNQLHLIQTIIPPTRSTRPKLTDQLDRVAAFSPKRPRSAQTRPPKVHLPDGTGFTSAVASPAKNGLDYHGYEGEEPREAEGTLFSSVHDDHLS
jgi:hypothetical protein